jgi:DNA-binding CsgD family transcriptional regulator
LIKRLTNLKRRKNDMANELKHIGTPRHSGRYPWGSGDAPNQRGEDLLGYISAMKKNGMSEVEIAKSRGLNTSQLRGLVSIENNRRTAERAAMAFRLKEKGYSNAAIGKRMGISDHTVKSLLDPATTEKNKITENVANSLKGEVNENRYVDVGVGVETWLGVSGTKKDVALAVLKEQGYNIYTVHQEQQGTGKYTIMKILAPPGTTKEDVLRNRDRIKTIGLNSDDGGRTFNPKKPPLYIDGKRVFVNYESNKDGVIELRRDVDDISLGSKKYAQVRVGVDGDKFMKGMAMYSDDVPKGYDIVYNTSKSLKDADKVFKNIEADDADYPFGAVVRQKFYLDKDGKQKQSALNIVGEKEGSGEEGAWDEWSKNISSQVLSKQTPALAKKQLKLAYDLKKEEYDEILSLTNPAVKQALLEPFADSADSAAVHLKAAALPGQSSKVILPITSLKEHEVYAPGYLSGTPLVLIRHPHGGIFEIPEVTVNNKNREGKRILGDATDVIGMHPKVAQKLSGADFDGDTVIAIPNKDRHIQTAKGLIDFDPKISYPYFEGMKVMDKHTKQVEMGKISNLITDMTIRAASPDEIARAVRHSMVVIDSEKHKLNYVQSYYDHNIPQLKKKYQGKENAGASTLISKAGATVRRNERVEVRPKKGDPNYTGDKEYVDTGRSYFKTKFMKDPITGKKIYFQGEGKFLPKQIKSTRMAEERNAFNLSSGTRVESVYAQHANDLKALARKARVSLNNMPSMKYSSSARKIYDREVESLKSQLRLAYKNKPLERQAQLIAARAVRAKRRSNPSMDEDDFKKIKGQELTDARLRVGAKKSKIAITDREWEAIQAGAVSHNVLVNILKNADLKEVKQRAMPRISTPLSTARTSRARSMRNLGHTYAEIAAALGVSQATVEKALK